jgi:hypothetical protein
VEAALTGYNILPRSSCYWEPLGLFDSTKHASKPAKIKQGLELY